jgi:uncharacterized repeat protein (TIGR03803 family)
MTLLAARSVSGLGLIFGCRVPAVGWVLVFYLTAGLSASAQGIQYQRLLSVGPPTLAGQRPYAGVIQADDGALFGTTLQGGVSNAGVIFRLNTDGTGATVLHTFGVAAGDGQSPTALVQGSDGVLYGTTSIGGTNKTGTIYKINTDGTGYQVVHDFGRAAADGANPQAGLVEGRDGFLYGTTFFGGSNGRGTVYRLNKAGDGYLVLHNFSVGDGDGANPDTALVQGRDGALYGTTFFGGSNDAGAIFRLNTNGSSYLVLRSFSGLNGDGQNPDAALMQGSDAALYGTTYSGGSNSAGSIFKLNTDGSGYTVLRAFTATGGDGQKPLSALLEVKDGLLYGTTYLGGSSGAGTVFKLNRDGTGYAVLRSFDTANADGRNPRAGVLQGSDLALYGTTWNGGESGFGTVFRLLPLAAPQMLDVILAGSSAQVRFRGLSGHHYEVFRSTNLVSWVLSGTVMMPASGIGTNIDSSPAFPTAWYRAAWVP